MRSLLMKLLAIPALILALLFASQPSTPARSSADAFPRPVADRSDPDYNPHNKRIKPYKYEHEQGRYTSDSTQMPSSAPCAIVGTNPAGWPEGVTSCEGPPPAPKAAPAPPPAPAAAPPAAPAGGNSGGNGGGGGGDAAAHTTQPTSSCG